MTCDDAAVSTKTDRLKTVARWVLAIVFIGIGVMHFVSPADFVAIMPPYLPWHFELVILSGVFEVLGGIGLLVPNRPRLRQLVGWGIVALLVAVFPANVQHVMHPPPGFDLGPHGWIRLPFQLVLIAWAIWVTKPTPPASRADQN